MLKRHYNQQQQHRRWWRREQHFRRTTTNTESTAVSAQIFFIFQFFSSQRTCFSNGRPNVNKNNAKNVKRRLLYIYVHAYEPTSWELFSFKSIWRWWLGVCLARITYMHAVRDEYRSKAKQSVDRQNEKSMSVQCNADKQPAASSSSNTIECPYMHTSICLYMLAYVRTFITQLYVRFERRMKKNRSNKSSSSNNNKINWIHTVLFGLFAAFKGNCD